MCRRTSRYPFGETSTSGPASGADSVSSCRCARATNVSQRNACEVSIVDYQSESRGSFFVGTQTGNSASLSVSVIDPASQDAIVDRPEEFIVSSPSASVPPAHRAPWRSRCLKNL